MQPGAPVTALANRIWRARALSFAFHASSAFLVPYLGLFLQDAGLSGVQIGWMAALKAVVAILGAPFWGMLADRSRRPLRSLQIALLGATLSTLLLGRQTSIGGITLGFAAVSFFFSGAYALTDLTILSQVRGTAAGFGTVRLGGSLGWTVVALLGGVWIERTSLDTGFAGCAVGLAATLVLTTRFAEPQLQPHQRSFLSHLRSGPSLRILAGALLIFGIGWTWPRQFMAIYATDLGGNEALVGAVSGVSAFSEWPFMLLGDRLVTRHRPSRVLMLALLLFGLTWAIGASVPSAGWLVPVGAVNAAAYSFYTVSLVNTLTRRIPAEALGTALGFFNVTLVSVADLAGGPLTGWVYDLAGGRGVYALGAGLAVAGAAALLALPRSKAPGAVAAAAPALTSEHW